MGSFSLFHWVVVILVLVLLFGRGKISDLMGDLAKGINSFKKGLADDAHAGTHAATPPAYPQPQLGSAPQPTMQPAQPYVQPVTQPVRDDTPRV